MTTTMIDESALRARYTEAGQGHVFHHIDTLSSTSSKKEELLEQLHDIRVEEIGKLLESALASTGGDGSAQDQQQLITPFSKTVGQSTDEDVKLYYATGMNAIAHGEVAALVLAGGQGTRLGFAGPKGMYDIGLPSGRTLFQLLCERLRRLQTIAMNVNENDGDAKTTTITTTAAATIPFYIMTSPINHQRTMDYFRENDYFGLPEKDVLFFQQGMLPCLTEDGKIIMETGSKAAMAPDG